MAHSTTITLRRGFRAMGTHVELVLDAGPHRDAAGALLSGEREVRRLEALLSRFRPDSELSRLNASGRMAVGPDLLALTRTALAERERTGGRFDPTVHEAMVAAGYDRTFEEVPRDGEAPGLPAHPCGGHVHVDERSGIVTLDPGVLLDLGGIAKGYAADRVADILAAAGPALASVGGDIAVRGPRIGGPWTVGVATGGAPLTLALEGGALATSGRDRRWWTRGGHRMHHIIDPSTGEPAHTDLLRVTVVAHCGTRAEATAKALMISGAPAARREADALGIPCVLVGMDGSTTLAGGLT
ncbi:MAG: FAD:protein FMN transferase [Thermoleophilia bacterium]